MNYLFCYTPSIGCFSMCQCAELPWPCNYSMLVVVPATLVLKAFVYLKVLFVLSKSMTMKAVSRPEHLLVVFEICMFVKGICEPECLVTSSTII